jgi:hypothetical protein
MANAQDGSVEGKVLADQKALKGATVAVSRLNDTTKLKQVLTNGEGRFVMAELPLKDSLKIVISFVGYTSFRGLLVLEESHFAMAPIELQPQPSNMDTIIVTSQKLVVVKGDTIEFNASRIKTPPNSVAADLVRRIPGMDLDRNGRITYNGRPVTKILVDGRAYFGEDGAIALANLPADMIEKVQLSGDSLRRVKERLPEDDKSVLNFKLKPGKKVIVKGIVAGGSHERYDGSVFGSQIEDRERISVTGGRNNINKTNYNGETSLQVFTSGSGITKTTIGAVDYGNTLKSGNSLYASYNFDLPTTFMETVKLKRQDVLPASTLITQAMQASKNTSSNHGLRYGYELKGRKTRMYFSGNTNYSSIDNVNINTSATTNGQGAPLNTLDNSFRSSGQNFGTRLSIDWSRSFSKKGRVLGWNASYNYSSRVGKDQNNAMMAFYQNGVIDSLSNLHQEVNNDSKSHAASLSANFTEPFGENFNLNLNSYLSYSWSYSDKLTWALDSLGKKQFVDSLYSNFTRSTSVSTGNQVMVGYHDKYWNVNTGFVLLHNNMLQKDRGRKRDIEQKGYNPSLNLNASYNTKKSSWNLNSSANYQLPSIEQLQPVQDATNPLQVFIGNPNLKSQVNYSASLNWSNKQPQNNGKPAIIISNAGGYLNVPKDRITNSVHYDTLGKQETTYRNVNGIFDCGLNANVSLQRKWGKDYFNIGLGPRVNFRKDRTFLNGELYDNNNLALSAGISTSYNRAEKIYLSLNYSPYYQKLRYEQNASQNQAYTMHHINFDADLYLFTRLKLKQSVSYTYNNSLNAGFNKNSTLWNASASLVCLKSRKIEVLAAAFDLLRQFNNLSRTVVANYIEDTQSNNLQRYFMVGFKYSFSKIF